MQVEVKLFAGARQIAGGDSIRVELADGATVRDLRAAVERAYPDLAPIMRRAMIAVDADYAGDDTVIPATAEVACIPPVSGG